MKSSTKLATVLLLQAALIHNALYAYAFVEEFNPPPPGSSAGWQVQSGSADVVSGVSGANGTALRLNTAGPSQDEASVSRPIPWNSNESIAFIDFLIKPAANLEGSLASILVNGTQVAFQVPASSNQGEIWALHGHDDNGANEAEWLKTPGVYTTDSSHQATAFVRVTLRHDYLRKVWDLFIDGKMASANLGFEGRAANLTQIDFFGSYVADTHIDRLQADPANMLFADADKDGLPDAWETANGSNPNLYDRDAIDPLTGKSFLEGYLGQLWSNATAPNGNGVVTVSSASIPPISILNQHQPVGALKGSMSVGGDGSGTYSIPIDLPKGTGGMEPKLSLNYSSGGGNGLLGVGWTLGGLQKITRGPSSAMKDRVFDKVDFDQHDRFFLDGERLICVSGTYGAAGSEYRTEMDAFSRIKLNGSAPLGLWWTLETKAGLIVELGNTADSVEAVGAGILSWSVNNVSDTSGNYYKVLYSRDPAPSGYTLANFRVSSISYTGRATMQPYSTVNFEYEARNDIGRAYTPHAGYLVSKRLSKIRVTTGNYVNHSYVLTYEESFQSNRSFLEKVQKRANDNPALAIPATSFDYDGLGSQEPLWSSNSASQWPVYSSGWDATSNVNSMVTAGDGGTSIRLDGDVSRSWNVGPGGITLFPDSVMTFEFQAQSLTSGALIGLDTDSFYQVFPARLFRIGGTGYVPVLTAGTQSYSEVPGVWSTYTLPVGQIATGVHSHLILMNVDDNAADGVASATFRNVKIYRTGSQTPASVAPLNFSTPSELPRFAKANGQNLGVRFMDLNSDGLPELCDWRATNYTLAAGSLIPNTVGQVYRNTGSSFVADPSLRPPTFLPLGYRADDLVAYNYDRMHHLLAGPVDINGDGKVDLLGSTAILYSGGSLSNSLSFHSRINGSWQELVSYRLPFRPRNLASTAPYGGTPRDSHYEWLDLDADGYTDLLYHTTTQGRLVDPINENVILAGANTTTAWLNKIHLGQGWVRNDTFALPEPLKVTFPVAGDKGRRLADLDGDGHPEVSEAVSLGNTELRKTYRMIHSADGTVTGWTSIPGAENPPAEPTLDLPAVPGNSNANAAFVNAAAEPMDTQLADLNGDGLPDIVKSMLSGNVVFRGIYLNRGGSQSSRWGIEPVAANAGAQRLSYDLPVPLNMYLNNQFSPLGYEMPDLNGDGLADVLLSQNSGSELYNRAYLNSGSGWIDRPAWGLPAGLRIYTNSTDATNGWRRAMLQDVNGDGFPDLITGLIGESPKIWMNNCRKEVLTSVTDGFGSTLQVEYRRLNDPTPVPGATEPTYQAGPSTMQTGHAAVMDSRLVVARLTEPDGRGGNRSTRRHYGDLRFDRVHEASLGFGWMEVYEEMQPAGQPRTVRGYSHTDTCRDYPNAGSPALTRSYVHVPSTSLVLPGVSTGYKLVSEETSTYGELYYYEGVGGIIRRPVQTGSVSKKWDLNGTLMGQTITSQTFEAPVIVPHTWVWNGTTMVPSPTDSFSLKSLAERNGLALPIYGFVANSTITALDGSSTVTTNNYSHTTSGGKWHLGRLSSSTVTKTQPGAAPVTKSSAFTYSADTGLIASETVQPSDALSVTTTYVRDVFGNVTSKTVAGSGQSRSSQTTYDARGRFPISETSHLGTVSTAYDDGPALVKSTTDLDGHVTTYEYDAFGTKIRTNLPDGTASAEITRYATNADLPAAVAAVIDPSVVIKWAKDAQASGTPVAKVWYDALGREIAASSLTLTSYNGNSGIWTEVYSVNFYDWKGRKEKTSEPFSAGFSACSAAL